MFWAAFIVLAFICVANQYFGELPWLSVMVGLPWTAYGVSQAFYYKKSLVENSAGGIKYETVLTEMKMTSEQAYENLNKEIEENLAGLENIVDFSPIKSDDPYII